MSEQSTNRTFYPLTYSQNVMLNVRKYCLFKQIMNIPTSVLIEAPMDLDLLKQATEIAISRNDSFAIRIAEQDKKMVQYFAENAVLTLEIKDFSKSKLETMEKFFHKVGATPMKLEDSPLAHVYIIKAPDGRCGLFSSVAHIIMDSWSISMFYKDVMAVYESLQSDTPLPKAMPSYKVAFQKELAYMTSPKREADEQFWINEVAKQPTLPIATPVNGMAVLDKIRKKQKDPDYRYDNTLYLLQTAKHEIIMIEKADIDLMANFCKENQIATMQVLFMLGLRTFLSRVNNRQPDVGINGTVARRGTIEEKYCGGTRLHFFPFRTRLTEEMTFKDALNLIIDKQLSLYRHIEYDPWSYSALEIMNLPNCKPGCSIRAMTLTFQPVSMAGPKGEKVSTRWYCNGTALQPFYLTVMEGDGTGALRCYYEYMKSYIKVDTVHQLHDYMLKVILAGVANPNITIGELLNLPV